MVPDARRGWNGVREDRAPVITHANGEREYRLSDHLASLRWRQIGDTTTQRFDYTPWGALQAGGPVGASERTFNENERDIESGEHNLGVRKYAEETGRFASVDPLWERDRGMSGYGYAGANPVREVDPEGMQRRRLDPARQESGPDIAGGIGGARGDYGSRSFWDVFKGCNARPPSTDERGGAGRERGVVVESFRKRRRECWAEWGHGTLRCIER